MDYSLVTAYPFWFILLCLVSGLAYALILYYRNRHNGFGKTVNWILGVLRAIAITFISFLLLSPLFKSTVRHTEKPIVVLAMDNSGSILISKDSAYYRKDFPTEFRDLADKLSRNYEVKTYSFAEKTESGIKGSFDGKQTDMGSLFRELKNLYSNRNLTALILAGDGIVTRGADPVFSAEKIPYSIYAIALGDTSQHKDLLIARVNYNRIAFLGNSFPIEVTVLGHKCAGSRTRLTVISGNKQLYSEEMEIGLDSYSRTIPITLTASTPGVQRYRIGVTAIKGEISTSNNFRDIFVEVLDGRQKILLLSSAPHPDIAAIKEAIEKNQNYEVEEVLLNEFSGNISKYNLVILHQVPSLIDAGSQLLSQLKENQVPVLYMIGSQSNLPAFNALQAGMNIPPSTSSFSAAYPLLNPDFSQFSVSNEVAGMLSEYPPLKVPFGQYKTGTSSEALLYQKIGSVSTTIPLIVVNQGIDRKSGIIAGEGIWRWRLTNYLKSGNHQAFDDLVSKLVQYLAVKEDKNKFRVVMKNYFSENEAVEIDAELYNDSYELVNDPGVNIVVSDKDAKNYPFTFTRTVNAYYLNAGSFPPGEYTFKATTSMGGKPFQKTGSFVVLAINEEMMNTVANHNLLYTLARQHNGEMIAPSGMQKLVDLLKSREDIKTVSYTQKKYTDLVNIFWVFLFLLTLLSAEWFLRKRSGGY